MKKIFVLFLFTSFSMFAHNNNYEKVKSIKKIDVKMLRSKCDIVADDLYAFCVDNGYTTTEATAISSAARKKCKELTKQ